MKLAVGIIAILWSLWLLYSYVFLYLPMKFNSFRSLMNLRATSYIIFGLFVVGGVCATGVALVLGNSWAWLILGITAMVGWMAIVEHGPGL